MISSVRTMVLGARLTIGAQSNNADFALTSIMVLVARLTIGAQSNNADFALTSMVLGAR